MNNEKRNEELISKFSESSKKLKTPDGLRDSNRKYIKEALNSINTEKRETPGWFKKRISISYPVAACFLLIFCLQITLGYFHLKYYSKTQKTIVHNNTDSIGHLEDTVQPFYSEHNVYVAGIGYVEKTQKYTYFKENTNEGI
ncbi:MAG: hypothetical protein JXA96_03515 [Sedimentisphaerales bacterium]|nr:hypothetical protein [Sedimentisphaerales bacterium]